MNREFLESLELEKEVIDKVMAEHGKAINTNKQTLEEAQTTAQTLKEQLEERDTDLKELKGKATNSDDLEAQLETLNEKYQAETQTLQERLDLQKKQSEIRLGVTKAGAKNEKAVMALLDSEAVQINDDGVQGLKEQIEKLQETDDYLFEPANDPSGQSSAGGNTGGGKKPPKSNAFDDAVSKFIK